MGFKRGLRAWFRVGVQHTGFRDTLAIATSERIGSLYRDMKLLTPL